MSQPHLALLRLGTVPYGQGLALQLQLRDRLYARIEAQGEVRGRLGYLICLEHQPVVTLGKRGKLEHLTSPDWLRHQGVEIFKIDRGGEATYHGPGQLVLYPIIALNSLSIHVVDLVRGLANTLAETLRRDFDVVADYDEDHPGLWTDEAIPQKIASVGMRLSRGVTTHGAAINICNSLSAFQRIVPCGMPDAPMTRLVDHCELPVDVPTFRERWLPYFEEFIDLPLIPVEHELPGEEHWVQPMDLSAES